MNGMAAEFVSVAFLLPMKKCKYLLKANDSSSGLALVSPTLFEPRDYCKSSGDDALSLLAHINS